MTLYGTIITGKHVRAAVEATLKRWMPDYIGEVARRNGKAAGDLPNFRSYSSVLEPDKFTEDQLPSCVIVAPGLFGEPHRRGTGRYEADWSVGVGAVVRGKDRASTFDLTEYYAAAVRAILVQHPSLGGFAQHTDWLGERYDELSTQDLRTIAFAVVQFSVTVEGVVDTSQGPTAPSGVTPPPDPGDWRTVQSVTVTEQDL